MSDEQAPMVPDLFADERSRRGRWRRVGTALLLVLLLGCTAAAWHWRAPLLAMMPFTGTQEVGTGAAVAFHEVERGDLRVVLTEGGSLRAVKNHLIHPKISRQQLTITWLAEEGITVKAGDVVASFDPKPFEDRLTEYQTEHQSQLRELEVAEAAVEIEVSNGKSMIAKAEAALEAAKVKLRTYIDLEAPRALNEQDKNTNELRQKVEEAAKLVSEAKRALDDGLFNEEAQRRERERALDNAQENHRTLLKQLDAMKVQRKIFRAYEYPQALDQREQDVENAELELAKAKIEAENGLNQKRANLERTRETLKRLERSIEEHKQYIEDCDLRAPVDGLVIYGDGQRYYSPGQIAVGQPWYGANALMTVPDLSSFEIDVSVAEEYRGMLEVGSTATVRVSALPDLVLTGEVKEISQIGQPRSPYDPEGPRAYKTTISLNRSDDRLVSGMSAEVEMLAQETPDILLVPLDALYNDAGQPVVFVKEGSGGVKRAVETGSRNIHFVEIREGLAEGESVCVAPGDDLLKLIRHGDPAEEDEAAPPAGAAPADAVADGTAQGS